MVGVFSVNVRIYNAEYFVKFLSLRYLCAIM